MRDKDFAELSGELSGAICLKTPVLLGRALELFRKSVVLFVRFFGIQLLFLFRPLINVLSHHGNAKDMEENTDA